MNSDPAVSADEPPVEVLGETVHKMDLSRNMLRVKPHPREQTRNIALVFEI